MSSASHFEIPRVNSRDRDNHRRLSLFVTIQRLSSISLRKSMHMATEGGYICTPRDAMVHYPFCTLTRLRIYIYICIYIPRIYISRCQDCFLILYISILRHFLRRSNGGGRGLFIDNTSDE